MIHARLVVATAALAAVAVPRLAAADPPVCRDLDANTRTCRIDRPVVTQRITAYPDVRFAPDDVVEIIAGGCVQTGGWGDTWKHYLQPRGPDSDERYFGMIQIPGVTAGLVRIASMTGRKFRVPAGVAASDAYLRLGYDDDGYGDNGYTDRDSGTCGQCVGEPDAWIDIVIRKNAGFSNPLPKDMDLFWWSTDANALPLNGHWWKRLMTGQAPDPTALCNDFRYETYSDSGCNRFVPACTSQALDVDGPSGANALCAAGREGRVSGHANYMPATYEGTIQWNAFDWWDDDHSWRLYPVGGAGLTVHTSNLGVERDGEETIARMRTAWWQGFRNADDGGKRALIDNKFAIVTGLLGFDCGHNPCAPELHPAYAMAIHVEDNPYDDQWAFFLSNYGDEGFCSQDNHPLDLASYTFRLPRATAGSTGSVILDAWAVNGNTTTQGLRFTPGVGVDVTFGMAPPANNALTDGVIHVGWAPHPDYQTGVRIPAATTPCATDLAAIDPYCVNNAWDSICTREARDLCPGHSVCTAGAKLAKLDSACVTRVCNADSYCCNNAWDGICVNEAKSMCSYTCAAGAP